MLICIFLADPSLSLFHHLNPLSIALFPVFPPHFPFFSPTLLFPSLSTIHFSLSQPFFLPHPPPRSLFYQCSSPFRPFTIPSSICLACSTFHVCPPPPVPPSLPLPPAGMIKQASSCKQQTSPLSLSPDPPPPLLVLRVGMGRAY